MNEELQTSLWLETLRLNGEVILSRENAIRFTAQRPQLKSNMHEKLGLVTVRNGAS